MSYAPLLTKHGHINCYIIESIRQARVSAFTFVHQIKLSARLNSFLQISFTVRCFFWYGTLIIFEITFSAARLFFPGILLQQCWPMSNSKLYGHTKRHTYSRKFSHPIAGCNLNSFFSLSEPLKITLPLYQGNKKYINCSIHNTFQIFFTAREVYRKGHCYQLKAGKFTTIKLLQGNFSVRKVYEVESSQYKSR